MLKFSAIDIGSNALRLLIMDVDNDEYPAKYHKHTLLRVPIRLGEDVFDQGFISDDKRKKLIWALKSFVYLSKVHDVIEIKACATSAFREAKNANEILKEIKKEVDLDIEIISGSKEAEVIHSYQSDELRALNKPCLYIDVGGGSTELSYLYHGKLLKSESFQIGTVRMLKNKVQDSEWKNMQNWIESENIKDVQLVGSGGNINKLIKIVNPKREDNEITQNQIEKIYKELSKLSFEDRMKKFDLNPDRADVIVPALKIFVQIMKWTKSKDILVPRIGLADGIIKSMYESYARRYSLLHS